MKVIRTQSNVTKAVSAAKRPAKTIAPKTSAKAKPADLQPSAKIRDLLRYGKFQAPRVYDDAVLGVLSEKRIEALVAGIRDPKERKLAAEWMKAAKHPEIVQHLDDFVKKVLS